MRELKSIELVLENCEVIEIDKENMVHFIYLIFKDQFQEAL